MIVSSIIIGAERNWKLRSDRLTTNYIPPIPSHEWTILGVTSTLHIKHLFVYVDCFLIPSNPLIIIRSLNFSKMEEKTHDADTDRPANASPSPSIESNTAGSESTHTKDATETTVVTGGTEHLTGLGLLSTMVALTLVGFLMLLDTSIVSTVSSLLSSLHPPSPPQLIVRVKRLMENNLIFRQFRESQPLFTP